VSAQPTEPSRWSTKPTLVGELVTLRPFVLQDAVTMAKIFADPELLKLTASVTTSEQAASFPKEPDQKTTDWYGSRSDQDDRLDLAVVDNATGELVGEVVLNEFDADANSSNFRTLIGAAGRGRRSGNRSRSADPGIRIRAAWPAPDQPGCLRLQPAREAGLRQGRLCRRGCPQGRLPIRR